LGNTWLLGRPAETRTGANQDVPYGRKNDKNAELRPIGEPIPTIDKRNGTKNWKLPRVRG